MKTNHKKTNNREKTRAARLPSVLHMICTETGRHRQAACLARTILGTAAATGTVAAAVAAVAAAAADTDAAVAAADTASTSDAAGTAGWLPLLLLLLV